MSRQGRGRGPSLLLVLLLFTFTAAAAAQRATTLTGQVKDPLGGVVLNATVTLRDAAGAERTATTGDEGAYTFRGVAPGKYTLRVNAPGFAPYEEADVEVGGAAAQTHDVKLSVTLEREEVVVDAEPSSSLAPEGNAGAIVMKGKDLDALPDDPDDLDAVLQALAGPAAGPNGGQMIVDGFTGGRTPPKGSIREVRINMNPFSAEFDQLGFGRIEILTKAGTDKFRGQMFFNFNDEALNARNPFAERRAPFQSRLYGGSVSGPLFGKDSSYFIDFQRRDIDGNAVINATVLDDAFNVTPFSQTIVTPSRFTTLSPRFDSQLNKNHTFVGRYAFARSTFEGAGVGNFNLASRAFDTSFNTHTLQLTETAVLSPTVVNELRFQFIRTTREQVGDGSTPTVLVLDSFTGGGSPFGLSNNTDDRWEVNDTFTKSLGTHTLRGGARLRGVRIKEFTDANFNGTYVFEGGPAPQLDASNNVVIDPQTGQPVSVRITSIERYRRTQLLRSLGLSAADVRARGGGATQFSVAGGDPEADVSQTDLGAFILDDWRARHDLTLSLGLRYEAQSNISNKLNFAPRLGFAWSPGARAGGPPPRTVVRGGFGIFYERFGEWLTLQARRFNGQAQQLNITTDPAVLDLFPSLPPASALAGSGFPTVTRRVAEDLREPYSMQFALSVERQMPHNTTVTLNYIRTRSLHLLRTRNVNAPLPANLLPAGAPDGTRPLPGAGDIYLYESSGRQDLEQLILGFSNRLSPRLTFFGSYVIGRLKNDTDGVNTFPVNSYDLSGEYGRGGGDIRHRFFLGGNINAPYGISLSPLVIATSSRPFNVTTGIDQNGDTIYAERPAFAADPSAPGVIHTPLGAFDPNPAPGASLVPRNYGDGAPVFWIALRAARTFGFGNAPARPAAAGGGSQGGPPPEKPYRLTISIQAQNIFNHTNPGPVIGNLSSPLFGQSNTIGGGSFSDGGGSNASGGNRRVELQLRFNF